jgi:hypothetical protein
MIPSPNLDDRKYDDIVEEAIRLIPQYCPEWTNFNRSDPGITLVQLFAWMTEMIIYRLNKVPDRNYLAFLNLMGIHRQPPQPARTVLTFKVSSSADNMVIPTGTAVATTPTSDRKAVSFETENDLLVTNNELARCVSQYHEQYSDLTDRVQQGSSFEIFDGTRSVERFLYLGDDRFENFTEAATLTLEFDRPNATERSFPKMLEWEYWSGERWRELQQASAEVSPDSIIFRGPQAFETTTVNDIESYWIRGRLVEVPDSDDETTLDLIKAQLEVKGSGVLPTIAYYNPQGAAHLTLDFDRNVRPFGDEPSVDNFLYIASDEVLSQPGTTVRLEIALSDPSFSEKPIASEDLILEWQYHTGKRWRTFGKTGPGHKPGKAKTKKDDVYKFTDNTAAFTKNGWIEFTRPDDIQPAEVNGQTHYWLRCHIVEGNYGHPGKYELIDDVWTYREDSPLRPPTLKGLTLRFSEVSSSLGRVLTYNDFRFIDESKDAGTEYKPFQAFQPVPEENPTLYLGFREKLPNDNVQIYFNVLGDSDRFREQPGTKVHVGDEVLDQYKEQTVIWEYWSGKEWALLFPKDGTSNFRGAGFVEFVGPKQHRKSRRYGDDLYWIRARLEMGGYDEPPSCNRILMNAVYAAHHTTFSETILGSSQGTPNQSFLFNRGPVLAGQQITVHEHERPSEEEIEIIRNDEGENAFVEASSGAGFVVHWHEVESLYESGPKSRHYIKDVTTNEVTFGDGVHGMLPPKGDRNIVARSYRVGGGVEGNVPASSITVLKKSLGFVDDVSNPFPAAGGADLEDIEDIKRRGPYAIKSRDRAVTREDYEWLAIQSSNSVARANCIPGYQREGEVSVVIVPKVTASHPDFMKKPVPTTELLRRVNSCLSERKLLTTVLRVVKPQYRELSAEIEIMRLSSGSADRVKREIEKRLRLFLHPLKGGRDERGWPFGRNVFKVDLYHVVEEVEGVDFVSNISIFDEDSKVEVEQILVKEDMLPFLVNVEVTEKAHEMSL